MPHESTYIFRNPVAAGLLLAVLIQACSTLDWNGDPAPQQASTSSPQRSSRGNPPSYEVFGERYYVLPTSLGYKERGVASWYGKKFHGKPTSSGEIYDMHEMTAAHKSLPLPTTVRVTNLRNGKSIVVKVNDRGPFIDNRIIDLSYVAAKKLDMVANGTALVEVEAMTIEPMVAPVLVVSTEPEAESPADADSSTTVSPIAVAAAETLPDEPAADMYLQIGAFGEHVNARQLRDQVRTSGVSNIVIRHDSSSQPAIYRVRLGPINAVDEYDALVQKMAAMQIIDVHLVIEPPSEGPIETSSAMIAEPSGT
jgi:rare lipoprotein A